MTWTPERIALFVRLWNSGAPFSRISQECTISPKSVRQHASGLRRRYGVELRSRAYPHMRRVQAAVGRERRAGKREPGTPMPGCVLKPIKIMDANFRVFAIADPITLVRTPVG